MLESEKDNLWLLFIMQSEQEILFEEVSEIGSWNLEIVLLRTEIYGYPNRECQKDKVVLEVGEENNATGGDVWEGHSYSWFLVLPQYNWIPVLKSFTWKDDGKNSTEILLALHNR